MADRIGVMNLGRLLEMGAPHELYTAPGDALRRHLPRRREPAPGAPDPDGIRFGETRGQRAPARPPARPREHEVVAVVRPEEIEVAADARDARRPATWRAGVVEEVVFTGALERMRVRLDDGAEAAPLCVRQRRRQRRRCEVTRTQHEQRAFQVRPGQSVAIGVRRVHVLPTPLSSFTACAPSEALADALSQQPLLVELATRMKTRISTRVEPQLGDAGRRAARTPPHFAGTTVIAVATGRAPSAPSGC